MTTSPTMAAVILLVWQCLCLTPSKRKAKVFARHLSDVATITALASRFTFVFAPGLYELLTLATSPIVAWIKSLPADIEKNWAVYLLLFERDGYAPLIYIGSATDARHGAKARFSQYRGRRVLPVLVEEALDDGFIITHYATLCTMPLPSVTFRVPLRAFFKAMEAAFTHAFGAMAIDYDDYGIMACLWDVASLEYQGLCTHTPLMEGVHGDDADQSLEQLEALEAERQAFLLAKRRNYKREWLKSKLSDPAAYEAYKAKNRERAAALKAQDPEHANTLLRDNYNRHKEEGTWPCELCGIFCGKKSNWETHQLTKEHVEKANGTYTGPSKGAIASKASREKGKASGKHVCPICVQLKPFANPSSLKTHFKSKNHIKLCKAAGVDPENPSVSLNADTGDVGTSDMSRLEPTQPDETTTAVVTQIEVVDKVEVASPAAEPESAEPQPTLVAVQPDVAAPVTEPQPIPLSKWKGKGKAKVLSGPLDNYFTAVKRKASTDLSGLTDGCSDGCTSVPLSLSFVVFFLSELLKSTLSISTASRHTLCDTLLTMT